MSNPLTAIDPHTTLDLTTLRTAMMSPFFGVDPTKPSTRGAKWEFTLHSRKTNTHLTFKSSRPKGWASNGPVLISVMNGGEDEWRYIGSVSPSTGDFKVSPRVGNYVAGGRVDKAIRTMMWLTTLTTDPADLGIYGTCSCSRCGRKLTNPDSINAIYGPECRKQMNTSTPAGFKDHAN